MKRRELAPGLRRHRGVPKCAAAELGVARDARVAAVQARGGNSRTAGAAIRTPACVRSSSRKRGAALGEREECPRPHHARSRGRVSSSSPSGAARPARVRLQRPAPESRGDDRPFAATSPFGPEPTTMTSGSRTKLSLHRTPPARRPIRAPDALMWTLVCSHSASTPVRSTSAGEWCRARKPALSRRARRHPFGRQDRRSPIAWPGSRSSWEQQ